MNKRYNVRKKTKTTNWSTVTIGHSEKIHLRSVDPKIVARMPSSSTTFVEHNAVRSLIQRIRHFIITGH